MKLLSKRLWLILGVVVLSLFVVKLQVFAQTADNKQATTTSIEVYTSEDGSQGRQMVTTCKNQNITRDQLEQELRAAYYPGPWTLNEELAAYQRAACPNQNRKDCLVCDQNKWRLLGGTGECKDSFPACDGDDPKSYEGCFPKDQKPGDTCSTNAVPSGIQPQAATSISPERCFVCDQGKWRLSGGKCFEDTITCKVDDNNTFEGCKDGGARTGDVCETSYKVSLNKMFKLKSAVAGIAVNNDTLITNTPSGNEYLSFKPCTKDSTGNQIKDIFLAFNVRRVSLDGSSALLENDIKMPNCDIKKISRSELGNLNDLIRLEISAAYYSDDSSSYVSSAASSMSLTNNAIATKVAVVAKPFVKLAAFPSQLTPADKEVVLSAVTSQAAKETNFTVESSGNSQKLPPSNAGLTELCSSGKGSCVYQLKLPNNSGNTKIKFCVDDNTCDNLTLQLNPPTGTAASQTGTTGANNNIVNNTDVTRVVLSISNMPETELPLNGNQIDVDLASELQDKTEAVGFLKVYYKDDNYNILPLKFKVEITPEEDGYGGCCEANPSQRLNGCPTGYTCTQANGACSTGLACEQK